MLFIEKVKTNQQEFAKKVEDISRKLGIQSDWLMLVMNSESGLNHKAVNPTGGATGLIQFMPNTARSLGTTTTALRGMTNVEQLDYVYKYFKPYTGKLKSYFDLYLVTFFPLALGKGDSFVMQTKTLSASIIAKQNPAINKNKDGVISVGEFREYVKRTIPKNVRDIVDNNTGTIGLVTALLVVGLLFMWK